MSAKLNIELNRPQAKAFQAFEPGHTVCIPWGRGVGKSYFMRLALWLLVAKWDGVKREDALKPFTGIRIIFLMPTLKQFKDIHGSLIEAENNGEWAFLGGKLDRTTWKLTFPGGSWIQPFPASAANSKAARGARADVMACDECDDVDPSVYASVAVPWFSEPWSLRMKLLGGTPRRGRYGLLFQQHMYGQDETRPRSHSFHATHRDSPETVSPEAVAEAKRDTTTAVYKREWECDFDAAEGLVYGDVWDDNFHVRKPPPDAVWSEIIIGGDFGYEDPGVLLLIGILGKGRDATAWVLREIHEQHQTEDWWVKKMAEWMGWYPTAKLYHDPSAKSRIVAYRKFARARPQEVDNTILDGIDAVADRLVIRTREDGTSYARLYVAPGCKHLRAEMMKYARKRDPRDPDRYLEDILDKHNHCADSIRYAIFNHLGPASFRGSRTLRHVEDRR